MKATAIPSTAPPAGGTTINGGTLLVKNTSSSGTLGGTGKIAGAVTVGIGRGPGAFLSPGINTASPGTLFIRRTLTFNSDATYNFGLKSSNVTADKVVAKGVTINSGALFSFASIGGGPVTSGTVFTVIDNTAATAIAGTFSNLADGSTFTVGSNTFQVSYEGGDGNDLTLTAVP